jgi:hypothetical protein
MSARAVPFTTLVLFTTLAMCGLAPVAASSQPSPAAATPLAIGSDERAMSSPSPGPSASVPASPAGTAEASPAVGAGLCAWFEDADVAGFLGAELISVMELPAQGSVIGGCEAIATNSVSLTLRLHDASGWDEHITSFDNEAVPTLPDTYYSTIVGLSYRVPNAEAYLAISLRPGFGVNDHIRALYLLLGQ